MHEEINGVYLSHYQGTTYSSFILVNTDVNYLRSKNTLDLSMFNPTLDGRTWQIGQLLLLESLEILSNPLHRRHKESSTREPFFSPN